MARDWSFEELVEGKDGELEWQNGHPMGWDEFASKFIERPTWRQVVGNVLVWLGSKIGTTYYVQ